MAHESGRALFEALATELRAKLETAQSREAIYELQVAYLGKKGALTVLGERMRTLSPEERRAFGAEFNAAKQAAERLLEDAISALGARARARELAHHEDLTGLQLPEVLGSRHLISQVRLRLERIFVGMGFEVVDGPHVEHERYNFDDLNIAADHPARDMQDTFFVDPAPGRPETGRLVLRTHTSPVQIRTMLARKPPIQIVTPGTVFRRDDDATHSPMFHQLEGLRIDRGVTMADLKATLYRFVGELFGGSLDIRFRPSYFPFVEPGAEFDVQCPFSRERSCPVCKGSGWLEVGGAGMVHPAVLENTGIDPEIHTGWAFGFGIDRLAMLLHAVPDLRLLFENDVRFLEQFRC